MLQCNARSSHQSIGPVFWIPLKDHARGASIFRCIVMAESMISRMGSCRRTAAPMRLITAARGATTIALIMESVQLLMLAMRYHVPAQDFLVDLTRIPTLPNGRICRARY